MNQKLGCTEPEVWVLCTLLLFQQDGNFMEWIAGEEISESDDLVLQEISSSVADMFNVFVNLECKERVEQRQRKLGFTSYFKNMRNETKQSTKFIAIGLCKPWTPR